MRLIKEAQMTCAAGVLGSPECNPSVALVAVALDTNVAVCTGALIEENLVLTAASCLPHELREEGANCKGRIQFAFAADSTRSPVSVGCDRVIEISQKPSAQTRVSPDSVVIRLEKSPKRPILVVQEQGGLSDGEKATSFRIFRETNGGSGFLGAKIEKITCQAKTGSVALLTYQGPGSPNALVSDCTFHKDQRGAPLLGKTGNLQAILGSEMPTLDAMGAFGTLLVSGKTLKPLIYATQVGCAPLSSISLRRPGPGCDAVENYKSSDELVKTAFNRMDQAAQDRSRLDIVKEWSKKHLPHLQDAIRWQPRLLPANLIKISQSGSPSLQDNVFFPFPQCFEDATNWRKDRRFRTFLDLFMKSRYTEGPFDLPRWVFRLRLDEYLRPAPEIVGAIGTVEAKLHFSPVGAKRKGGSPVTMEAAGSSGEMSVIAEEQVTVCPSATSP
ncbi:MAG: trypsin-like serine protease [Bdellovibrionales bacterium]|nr:trypsin-like serine protease [Bdellovibrionales bacterium]